MVIRADLNGHLKALKDYFLLAKGDFFQVSNPFVANENSVILNRVTKKIIKPIATVFSRGESTIDGITPSPVNC